MQTHNFVVYCSQGQEEHAPGTTEKPSPVYPDHTLHPMVATLKPFRGSTQAPCYYPTSSPSPYALSSLLLQLCQCSQLRWHTCKLNDSADSAENPKSKAPWNTELYSLPSNHLPPFPQRHKHPPLHAGTLLLTAASSLLDYSDVQLTTNVNSESSQKESPTVKRWTVEENKHRVWLAGVSSCLGPDLWRWHTPYPSSQFTKKVQNWDNLHLLCTSTPNVSLNQIKWKIPIIQVSEINFHRAHHNIYIFFFFTWTLTSLTEKFVHSENWLHNLCHAFYPAWLEFT